MLGAKKFLNLSCFLYLVFTPIQIQAQVIPDNTLGSENSTINSTSELGSVIEGGAIRGENLFHSFQEFSIGNGWEVYFSNPEGISNIFSRVTGSNISEILGTLGVEGNANLFFMNPNGIVFGENAIVDVGGSFIATTANEIEFGDGQVFSARDTEKPLLVLNVPIGLGLNGNNGSIIVRGTGHELTSIEQQSVTREKETNSLSVPSSKTFALIGGEVNFNGGIITSPSGNIEIGAVQKGKVKIVSSDEDLGKFNLNYDNSEIFGDITFATRSLLDSSSEPNNQNLSGGKITVEGRNILMKDGSIILNQNFGNSDSGFIKVSASESFKISGTDPIARLQGGIRTENLSLGNGADILIDTPKLTIFDGGSVLTATYSSSEKTSSGNIFLEVTDLEILGSSPISPVSISNIGTLTFGLTKAGDITVNSDTVKLADGAGLGSTGFLGSLGTIDINATKSINLIGFEPTFFLSSSIASVSGFSQNPGQINITTPNLYIYDGANINTSTFVEGIAGNIFINAENIEIRGKIPKSKNLNLDIPSSINSSASLVNDPVREAFKEILGDVPLVGNSGNINVITKQLKIADGGQILVFNQGLGNGGEINIQANSIFLDNASGINASTLFGEGGNVTINSDRIQIENNSNISASAGGEGNGGNVNITSDTFLALNDSDVTATAIRGNGGNITIDAKALLGIQERKAIPNNGTSDADASSEFGQDGTVTITNPQTNIQDPTVAIKDPEVNIIEPKFEPDCFEQKERLTDSRHDNIPRNPDTSFDDIPYLPSNNFIPPKKSPQFNPQSLEDLIWREGYPVASGNHLIATPDGKVLLVVESQFESLKRRGCISPEVEVIE